MLLASSPQWICSGVKSCSSKSSGVALGPSFSLMAWSNFSQRALWTSLLHSSSLRCLSVDLQTKCPLGIRIFAVSIDPTSMAGPRYLPRVGLSLENLEGSWYITQSNQPNWHIRLMSAVSPDIMVSGTCPAVIYMLLVEQEQIIAINSMQWSQSFFGEPVLIINQETPRLSSRIHLLAVCIHGE